MNLQNYHLLSNYFTHTVIESNINKLFFYWNYSNVKQPYMYNLGVIVNEVNIKQQNLKIKEGQMKEVNTIHR